MHMPHIYSQKRSNRERVTRKGTLAVEIVKEKDNDKREWNHINYDE